LREITPTVEPQHQTRGRISNRISGWDKNLFSNHAPWDSSAHFAVRTSFVIEINGLAILTYHRYPRAWKHPSYMQWDSPLFVDERPKFLGYGLIFIAHCQSPQILLSLANLG